MKKRIVLSLVLFALLVSAVVPLTSCGASKGFTYTVNPDGESITITGFGECNDKKVVIKDTYDGYKVTAIGEKAFVGFEHRIGKNSTSSFKSITLPEGLISIGDFAFSDLGSSEPFEFVIPSTVERIGIGAFGGNSNQISSFSVAEGNKNFKAVDGVLYSADGKELIAFPYAKDIDKEFKVPEEVETIAPYAFWGGSKPEKDDALATITLTSNIKKIDNFAFYKAKETTTINLPDSISEIGKSAFEGCVALKQINIPKYISEIGEKAFYGCKALNSVTFPSHRTTIGKQAFYDCGFDSVVIPAGFAEIDAQAFNCDSIKCVVDQKPEEWHEYWYAGDKEDIVWGIKE